MSNEFVSEKDNSTLARAVSVEWWEYKPERLIILQIVRAPWHSLICKQKMSSRPYLELSSYIFQ